MTNPTSNLVSTEWRCFHCDEVFTDREAAADHFGVQIDGCADDVACKVNATDGLLVSMLREAQAELRLYHQEDNAAFLQFHALGAEHAVALRRQEEKGYERGLEDVKKHPETLGLRLADETTAPLSPNAPKRERPQKAPNKDGVTYIRELVTYCGLIQQATFGLPYSRELEFLLEQLAYAKDDALEAHHAFIDLKYPQTTSSPEEPLPTDCSGDPKSCPDNEGTGCHCSRTVSAASCKRSHPHENMNAECQMLTLIARRSALARRSAVEPTDSGLSDVRDRSANVALTCSGACRYSNGAFIPDSACDTHGAQVKASGPICPWCTGPHIGTDCASAKANAQVNGKPEHE